MSGGCEASSYDHLIPDGSNSHTFGHPVLEAHCQVLSWVVPFAVEELRGYIIDSRGAFCIPPLEQPFAQSQHGMKPRAAGIRLVNLSEGYVGLLQHRDMDAPALVLLLRFLAWRHGRNQVIVLL